MKDENVEYLTSTYPVIFERTQYIACGDGWFDLIDTLCEQLMRYQPAGGDGKLIQAQQIKEKFGTLRFYVTRTNNKAFGAETMAEAMSESLCERCGKQGQLFRKSGYISCKCPKHGGPRLDAAYIPSIKLLADLSRFGDKDHYIELHPTPGSQEIAAREVILEKHPGLRAWIQAFEQAYRDFPDVSFLLVHVLHRLAYDVLHNKGATFELAIEKSRNGDLIFKAGSDVADFVTAELEFAQAFLRRWRIKNAA